MYALLALLAGIVIVVILIVLRPADRHDATAGAVIPVKAMTLTAAELPEVVCYAGLIEADRSATVSAEQVGRVVEIRAEKGAAVTPGQVLLVIDPSVHTLRVDRAEVAYRQATNDLKRVEDLRKTGSVPESEHENMITRTALAEIALREARQDLEKCSVLAPVAGVVQDRFVEKGEYIAPGMRAFAIVNTGKIKVVLDLPERDVYSVHAGDRVPFTVDAIPGRAFGGVVRFVAPAGDTRSNTFRVELAAENTDGALKPGVIARVSVTRRIMKDALGVPLAALIPEKGLHVAYVVENGHAVRKEVRLQAMFGDLAVVSEGLKAGDRVVVEGHRQVSDGSPVKEDGGMKVAPAPVEEPAPRGK